MKKEKKGKQFLSVLLAAAMLFTLSGSIPTEGNKVKAEDSCDLSNPVLKNGVMTWDMIYFGRYWQNDNNGDGKADQNDEKEPIRWRVLSVNGDDVFLLADQTLEQQKYHDIYTGISWEDCDLRKWLNDNFLKEAFTTAEQKKIPVTRINNERNPQYGTGGGDPTEDQLYLLSLQEAMNVDYGFNGEFNYYTEARIAQNTAYLRDAGVWTSTTGASRWWLRSPGYNGGYAIRTNENGWGDIKGVKVNDSMGVRPVLHLKRSDMLLTSTAKAASKEGYSVKDITYTLRYPSDGSERAVINLDSTQVKVTNAAGKYLMVEKDNGVYAYALQTGNETVMAGDIRMGNSEADKLSDFMNCKVWLESTDPIKKITTAVMATRDTKIDSVAITGVTVPESGKILNPTAVSETKVVKETTPTVTWTAGAAIADFNTIYTASVTLTPWDDLEFTSNVKATINGEKANVTRNADGTVTVTYTFPATCKADNSYGLSNPVIENDIATWDTIYFGKYWQNDTNRDEVADKKDEKEPIRWRVLSVNGDEAFLLADQSLDFQPYNEEDTAVTWETCSLRKWLNQEFLQTAFTEEEQKAILFTEVTNEKHPKYGTEGGNDTKDQVYLLSIHEVSNPAYGFQEAFTESSISRIARATFYVEGGYAWWLRSPGDHSNIAALVDGTGLGHSMNNYVNDTRYTVRPAMKIKLSSSCWSLGKTISSDGTEGNDTLIGLKPADPTPETPGNLGAIDSGITKIKAKIKSAKNVKGRKITVKLKKLSGAKGYQIKYATNKKFKKAKTKNSTKLTYTLKKLTKNKTYYIKARAYALNGKKKVYSKWSAVKKVKKIK